MELRFNVAAPPSAVVTSALAMETIKGIELQCGRTTKCGCDLMTCCGLTSFCGLQCGRTTKCGCDSGRFACLPTFPGFNVAAPPSAVVTTHGRPKGTPGRSFNVAAPPSAVVTAILAVISLVMLMLQCGRTTKCGCDVALPERVDWLCCFNVAAPPSAVVTSRSTRFLSMSCVLQCGRTTKCGCDHLLRISGRRRVLASMWPHHQVRL